MKRWILCLSGFVWRSWMDRKPRLCGFTRGQVPSWAHVIAIKGLSEQRGPSVLKRPGYFMRAHAHNENANKNMASPIELRTRV